MWLTKATYKGNSQRQQESKTKVGASKRRQKAIKFSSEQNSELERLKAMYAQVDDFDLHVSPQKKWIINKFRVLFYFRLVKRFKFGLGNWT